MKIKELEAELKEKNTYIHHFLSDKAKAGVTTSTAAKKSSAFGFDKVYGLDDEEPEPEKMNAKIPNKHVKSSEVAKEH